MLPCVFLHHVPVLCCIQFFAPLWHMRESCCPTKKTNGHNLLFSSVIVLPLDTVQSVSPYGHTALHHRQRTQSRREPTSWHPEDRRRQRTSTALTEIRCKFVYTIRKKVLQYYSSRSCGKIITLSNVPITRHVRCNANTQERLVGTV